MNPLAGLVQFELHNLTDRLLKKLDPLARMSWAAYVGADAQLRASQRREEAAQGNFACMARDWRAENNARRSFEKQNEELRSIALNLRAKLDLLIQHSNSTTLGTWREACLEQGIVLGRDEA